MKSETIKAQLHQIRSLISGLSYGISAYPHLSATIYSIGGAIETTANLIEVAEMTEVLDPSSRTNCLYELVKGKKLGLTSNIVDGDSSSYSLTNYTESIKVKLKHSTCPSNIAINYPEENMVIEYNFDDGTAIVKLDGYDSVLTFDFHRNLRIYSDPLGQEVTIRVSWDFEEKYVTKVIYEFLGVEKFIYPTNIQHLLRSVDIYTNVPNGVIKEDLLRVFDIDVPVKLSSSHNVLLIDIGLAELPEEAIKYLSIPICATLFKAELDRVVNEFNEIIIEDSNL